MGDLPGDWRSHFPIFEHSVHLNSCSHGALAHEVEAAYRAYLDSRHAAGADWGGWIGRQERLRGQFAQLVNAAPAEVAITTSASAALNTLVSALHPTRERNKIVTSDFEFPTAGQIWHAQEPRGFEVVHARETREGEIPVESFDELIDERTLAVSIAHICYRHGAMNDIEAVVKLARAKGAMVILDAYQSLGAVPIDVKALDVDCLIGGAVKYLLASGGLGFLYVRKDLASQLTPYATGWFGQANIDAMDIYNFDPAPDARRFESGTPPIPAIHAGEAALEIILKADVGAIRAHVSGLTERLKSGLADLGATLATPADPARHGALIAVKTADMHAMVDRLAQRNFITSCRDDNLRISPHFYNTRADIDAVLEAIADNRDLLA